MRLRRRKPTRIERLRKRSHTAVVRVLTLAMMLRMLVRHWHPWRLAR